MGKLWPMKENGAFAIIANAFCNGCVGLPDFDLLIISLSVKRIFHLYYIDSQLTIMQSHLKG